LSRHFIENHPEEQGIVLGVPTENPDVEEIDDDPKQDVLQNPVLGQERRLS